MLGMFINITVTTLIAINRPSDKLDDNVRKKAPFFFKEVRLGQLVFAGLYNLGRFIYKATLLDPSSEITSTMIVIAVRICVTVVVFMEHRWLCRNWEEFYVQRGKKAYLWFRFFLVACLIHIATGLRQMSVTDDGVEMMFSFVSGLNMLYWYFWGMKFQWREGDMTDTRRLIAARNAMSSVTVIYLIYSVYDIVIYNVESALTPLVVMVGHFTLSLVLFKVANRESSNRNGFWHTYKSSQVQVSELQQQEEQQQQPLQQQQEIQRQLNNNEEEIAGITATGDENKKGGIHQEDEGKNHTSGKQATSRTLSTQSQQPQPQQTASDDNVVSNDISPTITVNISRASRATNISRNLGLDAPTTTTEDASPNWRAARRVKAPFQSTPGTARYAQSMRATWSVMRRTSVNVFSRDQRELLEKRLQRLDVGYMIGDKIVTVVPQVILGISPPPSIIYLPPQ